MQKTLFLEDSNATKTDNKYYFKFERHHEDKVKKFVLKNAVCSYAPTATSFVTRAEVLALSVVAFLDMTDETKITEVGEYLTQINSQNSGSVVWTFSSNTAFKLVDLGQGKAMESFAAWHWGGAASPTEKPMNNSEEAHLAMNFMRTGTTERRVWDDDSAFPDIFISGLGVVWQRETDDQGNTDDKSYNVVLSQNVPYLLSFQKVGDQYTCKAEQLTTPFTIQTDTQTHLDYSAANNSNHKISTGDAQYGNQGFKWGSFVHIKGDSANDVTLVHRFLREQYTGVGTEASSDVPNCLKLCSKELTKKRIEVAIEKPKVNSEALETLNYIKQTNDRELFKYESIPRVFFCTTPEDIVDLDIYFTKPNGEIAKVTDFSVVVDLFH